MKLWDSSDLAIAFAPEDLAEGIAWTLAERTRHDRLCAQARASTVNRYVNAVVSAQYRQVYELACRA
ncbi:MAG: hypothetical protein ACOY41_03910 [Pseudomonadota bacterium]